ncbi:MAG: hypothetical protein AMQ74_00071 [Candidatus Methanofastidiosum methylothiophilum]|uniref:L-2-amino-thiazoline-4-carboxylic acid hydrolase n=1 Tax=Candidatus Methanofastidiosum methylothiophilum TaxID=1705564 RepID=A0A150JAR0_9EURY|nr:MAG: hypothetical protein AMQ74_00071 [Candidatus Methanofastidiosum methylthiophilus]NMC77211.1 hypothetical protein [Candidatus Methanofastidiosa archaeon]
MDINVKLKYTSTIMNAWLYGVENTANIFFDKPKLFYRRWGTIAIKPFIESWNDLGMNFQKGLSPYNTAKMFIDALVKAEFINSADFEMAGDDNNFTFKAIQCPYKSHCSKLIAEGKEIACLRAITLLGAMEYNKEGESLKYMYKFDFNKDAPCLVSFEKFKD